jgi:hypothetical protein
MDDAVGDPAVGAGDRPRAAWYVATTGGWRDWVSVLHLPYTSWHLAYVLIGAGLAAHLSVARLLATLAAFALAVGIAAHCLDELRGRPLGTSVPAAHLAVAAVVALTGAVALGAAGVVRVGWGLAGFIAVGLVLVVAYNLELWGGRLHNDAVFALAWGAFPVLTSYYAQTAALRPAAVAAAAFAVGLSAAQRALSSEARDLRRRVASLSGEKVYRDGARSTLTRENMLRPMEKALVALSWSTCALGVALVLSRTGH